MKMEQIKAHARKIGIEAYKMRKNKLIRTIQRAENNIVCYGSERVLTCQEYGCLWRDDCLAANVKKPFKKPTVIV